MATHSNKPLVSLWLSLLLLAVSSGLMLFINSQLDPAERAFGIAHGTTLDTQHARIYKFDNIDVPSTEKLRAAFPSNRVLVDNSSDLGVIRLVFLGLLAFITCLSLRFFWIHVRDHLSKSCRSGFVKKLAFLIPVGLAGYLFSHNFSTLWLGTLYCLLAFQLSFKAAKSKVKPKSFVRTLKLLRFLGLVWFSQVAFITVQTDPEEHLGVRFVFFSLVFLLTFMPTLVIRQERVFGDQSALEEQVALWSSARYWLLTIGASTAIVQLTGGFDCFLGGWANFLWPTLALGATKIIISSLGEERVSGGRDMSALCRVVACSWFPLGLPLIASFDHWQFQEQTLAIWLFGIAVLFRYGRPWGSTAKRHKPTLGESDSRVLLQEPEMADQSLPEACGIVIGLISIVTVCCMAMGPVHLPEKLDVDNLEQTIVAALSNQHRTLEVGGHSFKVNKGDEVLPTPQGTLNVQETWPEFVGLGLLGLAGFLALVFAVLWTNHQWDRELRDELEGEAFPILGAAFGAYALGGLMGWHWASPMPYLFLYFGFLTSPTWLAWIPLRSRVPAQFSSEIQDQFGDLLFHLEEEHHFRDALEMEVVAGKKAAKHFSDEGLEASLRRYTGHGKPQVLDSLESNLVHIICAGKVCCSQMIHKPTELHGLEGRLQSVFQQRARRILTYDRVQSWMDYQSQSFPCATQRVRNKYSIGTLQAVLRALVREGSMLEEPEVILDVLATTDGDEQEIVRRCLEALELAD